MNTRIATSLAVGAMLLVGAGCATARTVEVSFRVDQVGTPDAPVSDVILVTKGIIAPGTTDADKRVGIGQGCEVVEPANFDFPDESIAEVYCYSAGAGDVFQARTTASGDLEVVRYLVSEVPDYENETYDIQIDEPESVYTFDLDAGWNIIAAE
ncbi:MAG: hypothetical protein NUV56_00080 [Candidatus Uhrbacteria bacterium]|nr:hypothetical protein [Candidatus Uhrbacteria bacterium]